MLGTDGAELPVGHIISHSDAWRHCLPGYGFADPIAEPADDETAEFVQSYRAYKAPIIAQHRAHWQKVLNRFAAEGKLSVDPATGFFARDASGNLVGKLKPAERHVLEVAFSHGLKPEAPPEKSDSKKKS